MKRNDDERYAKVVAGCAAQTALTAVGMIETREGLELAKANETRCQGRGTIIAAIDRRLSEMRRAGK